MRAYIGTRIGRHLYAGVSTHLGTYKTLYLVAFLVGLLFGPYVVVWLFKL